MNIYSKYKSTLVSASEVHKLSKLNIIVRGVLFGSGLVLMGNPLHVFAETSAKNVTLEEVEVVAPFIKDIAPDSYHTKRSRTATKTDAELRDVPQSITVIPQDLIKDQSIQSISQAVQYVPGVQAAQGEGNRDALVFRGNATTGDLFVDGLRDDIQTYRDLYNTDRIEVLKGANGMIFGRGGAGGVLNRVTKQAGWDPVSQIIASYGAYDHKRIAADFGQGLNDQVAFRINAVYEDSGSYRDGVDLERFGVAPTLTFKPNEDTKIVVGAEYFKDKRVTDRGVPSQTSGTGANANKNNRPYRIGDYDTFFGNADLSPTETETNAFNASIEHSFFNGMTIKNNTRYANYDKYYQNVYARGPVSLAGNVQFGAYRDETDRINFINQTDITYVLNAAGLKHELLAGAEFTRQDTKNRRITPSGGENLAGSFPASNPVINGVAFNTVSRDFKSDVSVAGIYLQDQVTFNPHWQAIVGLRYDNFDTDFHNKLNSTTISVSDNLLSPRAGLIYKPVEAVSLYTNYSISYVPRAGDQLTSLTVSNATFKPEKFLNKEIGAKWDINSKLAMTAAVYKLERQNVEIANPADTGQRIIVDGQETSGIEIGLSGNVTDRWSLFGGIALQRGEITKQQGAGSSAILKGTELAQTPDRTFSLWNKYEINDMWAVALGIVGMSERFAALPTATTSTILPGYTRYDAAVFGKLSQKLSMQFNIENLTNKEYALYSHNNNNITPGSPITGRATMIYNF